MRINNNVETHIHVRIGKEARSIEQVSCVAGLERYRRDRAKMMPSLCACVSVSVSIIYFVYVCVLSSHMSWTPVYRCTFRLR